MASASVGRSAQWAIYSYSSLRAENRQAGLDNALDAQLPKAALVSTTDAVESTAQELASSEGLLDEEEVLLSEELQAEVGGIETQERSTEQVVVDESANFGLQNLPAGALTGTLVHAVMEEVAFDAKPEQVAELVLATCKRFGWQEDWVPAITRLVMNTLQAQFLPGLSLNQLQPNQALSEGEFYVPFASRGIATMIQMGLGGLDAGKLRVKGGFLRGFIDLIVQDQGKYHVIDFKTNWLGKNVADYRGENLDLTVSRSGYASQLGIYQIVLHRWLERSLPGYRPEHNLGSAFLLFQRGMQPRQSPGHACWQLPLSTQQTVKLADSFRPDDLSLSAG